MSPPTELVGTTSEKAEGIRVRAQADGIDSGAQRP
jgi:hypothetical protein